MADRSYRWLLWTLVLVGASLDQGSKYGVFRWLYNDGAGGEYVLVPGAFKLLAQYTNDRETGDGLVPALRSWSGEALPKVNHGALFGLGQQYTGLANGLFSLVSVLAAVAITYWSTRPTATRDAPLCAALGL